MKSHEKTIKELAAALKSINKCFLDISVEDEEEKVKSKKKKIIRSKNFCFPNGLGRSVKKVETKKTKQRERERGEREKVREGINGREGEFLHSKSKFVTGISWSLHALNACVCV
jgi:hypothetical protein